jgi:serine O-acetyltransferase
MFDNLRADFSRAREIYYSHSKRKKFIRRHITLYFHFGTMAIIVFRFGKWATRLRTHILKHFFCFMYLLLKLFIMIICGMEIVLRTDIGKGFIIHNFSGIFINAIRIGENCTVNQGVTIGSVIKSGPHPPVIGNNVYFGAGCKVLGNITIGNNVTIAANSLVICSVPDNCTVMGVPARVVALGAANNEQFKKEAKAN